MNYVAAELMDAYRREEELYLRILQLVEEQMRAMKEDADTEAVFGLCSRVEELLDEIGTIEDGIQPTKEQWQGHRDDLPPELESVLERIQSLIEQTAQKQAEVQEWMARHLCRGRQPAAAGAGTPTAQKAREQYASH